jgi:hypothetical protein
MIRYALRCDQGDKFEAWFSNSADFDAQAAGGLIQCPLCGSVHVEKALMAPAVRTSKSKSAEKERATAMAMATKVREHIRDNFDYVGDSFADEARKIHEGAAEDRPIWGEATPTQAKELAEEGVPVAPLPPALAPKQPNKLN